MMYCSVCINKICYTIIMLNCHWLKVGHVLGNKILFCVYYLSVHMCI